MDFIEHRTFEQAISLKLMEWEQTKNELEKLLVQTDPAFRDSIQTRITKLAAKHSAAVSNLKEIGRNGSW